MLCLKPTLVAVSLLACFVGSAWGQEQIPWITDLRQARQMAEQQQRVVLLHFWSDSCPPCRLLEQNVFNQPELIRVISAGFIPVKINVLQQTKYAEFYKVDRVPMDILVDHTGKELYRATSPQKIDGYIAMLDQVRAQVGIDAGRALEALAQNQLNKFSSALPPMAGLNDNVSASEPINSDPRAQSETNLPWQTAGANQANPLANRPQPTHVQNQFAAADSNAMPRTTPVSSRQENPYVQARESTDTSTASQNNSGPKLWGAAAPANGNLTPEPDTLAGNEQQPTVAVPNMQVPNMQVSNMQVPNMPVNMSEPNPNTFAGQPQVAPAPANGAMKLPTNVPPLALDGFCPVTLVLASKWAQGDPQWGAIHRGRTYLLRSQADQQRFLADPERFSPALSGYDPVRFTESGQLVEGKREHGLFLTNSYYLFADEAALSRFESRPQGYVNAVRQAMANSRPAPQR